MSRSQSMSLKEVSGFVKDRGASSRRNIVRTVYSLKTIIATSHCCRRELSSCQGTRADALVEECHALKRVRGTLCRRRSCSEPAGRLDLAQDEVLGQRAKSKQSPAGRLEFRSLIGVPSQKPAKTWATRPVVCHDGAMMAVIAGLHLYSALPGH